MSFTYLKASYVSGTSGYNIWSNGFCEQWGYQEASSSITQTISLLKTMKNTDYNIQLTGGANASSTNPRIAVPPANKTTTTFQAVWYGYSASQACGHWKVNGYLASGQY